MTYLKLLQELQKMSLDDLAKEVKIATGTEEMFTLHGIAFTDDDEDNDLGEGYPVLTAD